jgi:hypothetical protein
LFEAFTTNLHTHIINKSNDHLKPPADIGPPISKCSIVMLYSAIANHRRRDSGNNSLLLGSPLGIQIDHSSLRPTDRRSPYPLVEDCS